jgi:hypothetical protein
MTNIYYWSDKMTQVKLANGIIKVRDIVNRITEYQRFKVKKDMEI